MRGVTGVRAQGWSALRHTYILTRDTFEQTFEPCTFRLPFYDTFTENNYATWLFFTVSSYFPWLPCSSRLSRLRRIDFCFQHQVTQVGMINIKKKRKIGERCFSLELLTQIFQSRNRENRFTTPDDPCPESRSLFELYRAERNNRTLSSFSRGENGKRRKSRDRGQKAWREKPPLKRKPLNPRDR